MDSKTVFISYCHKDISEEWVEKLVTILSESGIECIVDIYDLRLGQDINYFMEQIKKADNVLMLLGKVYKEKADERKGGVGAETQIISSDVYNDVRQTKCIPIVVEKDKNGKAYLPIYLKDRLYEDLSSDVMFANNIGKIIRQIQGLSIKVKPQVILEREEIQKGNKAEEVLKKFLESWSKTDFHNEEKRKDIEEIYQFYKENFNRENCSKIVIDIGYKLTDIFERDSKYNKSLEIAKQILSYYDLAGDKSKLFDKDYIRKMIGCAYSIAIAKVSDMEKRELLKESPVYNFYK